MLLEQNHIEGINIPSQLVNSAQQIMVDLLKEEREAGFLPFHANQLGILNPKLDHSTIIAEQTYEIVQEINEPYIIDLGGLNEKVTSLLFPKDYQDLLRTTFNPITLVPNDLQNLALLLGYIHDLNYSKPEFYGSFEEQGMDLIVKSILWEKLSLPLRAVVIMSIKQTDISSAFKYPNEMNELAHYNPTGAVLAIADTMSTSLEQNKNFALETFINPSKTINIKMKEDAEKALAGKSEMWIEGQSSFFKNMRSFYYKWLAGTRFERNQVIQDLLRKNQEIFTVDNIEWKNTF